MAQDTITIYHNPRCSNSRGALALLEAHGVTPKVVDYLHAQLDAAHLGALIAQLGLPVREVMRSKEAVYQQLDLDGEAWTEEALIAQIAAHPELLNRPIVVSAKGARLCRPPERVLDLL